MAKFTFLFKKRLLPKHSMICFCLETRFIRTCMYNTRNSKAFYIFSCRTNIRHFAIRFQRPKAFNSLYSEIWNAANISNKNNNNKSFISPIDLRIGKINNQKKLRISMDWLPEITQANSNWRPVAQVENLLSGRPDIRQHYTRYTKTHTHIHKE